MSEEVLEIQLEDHLDHNGKSFGQWRLYVNGSDVGFVQQRTGFIHLTERLAVELQAKIKRGVEQQIGRSDLPVGSPPAIPKELLEEGDDDDDDDLPG